MPATLGFAAGLHPIAGARPNPVQRTDFHRQYVRTLTVRFLNSQQAAARLSQAFQAFNQDAFGIPPTLAGLPQSGSGAGTPEPPQFRTGPGPRVPLVPLPAGETPLVPSLDNLLNRLVGYTDLALSTFVERSQNVRQSLQNAPHYTPLAQLSLIPYAHAQIAAMADVIRANPPQFNEQTGALIDPTPFQATEVAFSNILNAVAEYSVHPNLFLKPENFYILHKFPLPFDGTPAKEAQGFYVLGPGGQPLPGA